MDLWLHKIMETHALFCFRTKSLKAVPSLPLILLSSLGSVWTFIEQRVHVQSKVVMRSFCLWSLAVLILYPCIWASVVWVSGVKHRCCGAECSHLPAIFHHWVVCHQHIILFKYDIHHLSSSPWKRSYHLRATKYNLPLPQELSHPWAQQPTL